jgi:membrane-associated protease RseP (regulator of RpoE activity)
MPTSRWVLQLVLALLFTGPPVAAGGQTSEWMLDQPFGPQRGRIGVQVQPMSQELREYFGVPADRGLLVSRVEPGRPAAAADLRVGDVIVAAGDAPMREPFDLTRAIGRVPAGESIELGIIRDKREHSLTVRPEGESSFWLDPDRWRELAEQGMRHGSEELRKKLDSLERRLEELERKLDQKEPPHGADRT